MAGGGKRLACLATINLSQISEFALVICSLGQKYGHVKEDTLAILIYTFALLGILSTYSIRYNYHLYGLILRACKMCSGSHKTCASDAVTHFDEQEAEGEAHADRDIVMLGFQKTAAWLITLLAEYSPHLLEKMHVIDYHEDIMSSLKQRGVTCAYGDISSPDVLEHSHHGEVRLVVSSIPDQLLRGVTNLRLLQNSKRLWPHADFIGCASTPAEVMKLYEEGAAHVMCVSQLCAEKLSQVIIDHSTSLRRQPTEH